MVNDVDQRSWKCMLQEGRSQAGLEMPGSTVLFEKGSRQVVLRDVSSIRSEVNANDARSVEQICTSTAQSPTTFHANVH